MVKINHKQQHNDGYNWKCGAVCLEMIFDYYNIECDKSDIWENIKTLRPKMQGHYYAPTHKVTKCAIEHGLNATAYKAQQNTCLELLEQINDKNIPAVLAIREKKSGQSHFVVYTGIKNKMYYYSDPNSNRDFDYLKRGEIMDVWSPQPQIDVTGYFFVVFDCEKGERLQCQNCGVSIPIVHNSLWSFIEGVACPYCGAAAYIKTIDK